MGSEQGGQGGWIATALLSALVAACGGGRVLEDVAAGGSAGKESGESSGSAGAPQGSNASAATDRYGGGCEVVSTTDVGWDEQTELGAPSEIFGALGGSCEAAFSWDGSGWSGTLTVDPVTGQSTLATTVEVDEASARWVRMEPADSSLLVLCGSSLEVEAQVSLELDEGTIVQAEPVTVAVSDGAADLETSPRITFSLEQDEFGDWVSLETEGESTTATMSVEMMPVGRACAGSIGLSATTSLGGGMGTGSGQPGFATWSDTGCGVGEVPVDLGEPFEGVDLVGLVEDTFDQHEFDALWQQDGTDTVLTLQLAVAEQQVCAQDNFETLVAVLPVDVVASTADGLVDLSAPATVHVILADGVVTSVDLYLSADFACQSETDTLPYQGADCSTDERMTAQFGVDYSPGSDSYYAGEFLYLYVRQRQSTMPAGAFDRMDELALVQ